MSLLLLVFAAECCLRVLAYLNKYVAEVNDAEVQQNLNPLLWSAGNLIRE